MVAISAGSATPGAQPVIAATSVSKIFESGDGIRAVDLDVHPGTIVGLIGPSGSGKTTAVRLMNGVLAPTDGRIEVLGDDPQYFDAATRNRLGYMPQHSVLYPSLSVWENLTFFAALYGTEWKRRDRLEAALDFVELSGHESKRVSDISGGMKRRLALATTLIHRPELVFLDEPTAGIDPILRRKFWDRFTELKSEGKTLVVTTQYVGEAAYCDYVAVLADGELLLVETPDGLRRAAYGGDIVDVEFGVRPDHQLIDQVSRVTAATECTPTGPRSLRLTVEEAAVAIPALSTWLGEQRIKLEQAEEWLPPFDDVFVELVNQHRNGSDGATDATGRVLAGARDA